MSNYPPPPPGAAPSAGSPVTVLLIVFGVLAVGGVCVIGLLMTLFVPAISRAREAARRVQSTNNLRQIGLAMHGYHDAYDSFPPAYVADADGKPLYSWRVLILPFLEQDQLYQQFNKDEAWDGPNNRRLSQTILKVYQDPMDPPGKPNTSYVAVVGPGTIFEGPKASTFGRIRDGTSNTVMVAQIANSTINWAEPKDLDVSRMSPQINAPGESISGKHPGGALVCLADGAVRFLPDKTPPETVRGLVTSNGGEIVELDY